MRQNETNNHVQMSSLSKDLQEAQRTAYTVKEKKNRRSNSRAFYLFVIYGAVLIAGAFAAFIWSLIS